MVARRPHAPGSLHWRHPPLAERTAVLSSARPLDLAHRRYRAPSRQCEAGSGPAQGAGIPVKFTTQAFGKRPALGGGQLAEINSSAPPLRLDPPNALGEE